ncbi:type II toxin-antitoxin system VapC family toxin [Mesorhizobium sp. CAU 1732]|uniref:type II toxin-antitoxin system VapC family toxin n=1 Tax=Mesorhizobium sp. CAU 1732 TaxID=3140358 RepID=UPI003260172A
MPLVVDSSVAISWVIADEDSTLARQALAMVYAEDMIAPRIFWYEFRNTLIVNERRGRIREDETAQAIAVIEALDPVLFNDHDDRKIVRLARRHGLSVYDAAYLELAARKNEALVTLDRKLETAALQEGVTVLQVS